MPRAIAVVNQKGGVGKTTTAISLAAGLALAERPTVLVDLDPQGNATTGLGVTRLASTRPFITSFLGTRPPRRPRRDRSPIPELLPSDIDLVGAEIELVGLGSSGAQVAGCRSLRFSLGTSYIIVDCPPSLGLLTLNALAAADRALVPLQCEFYALEGWPISSKTVKLVRER